VNIAQAYEKVNLIKPVDPVTPLTLDEATRAVRKMYRHLSGHKFPYRITETSGNRYTWLRGSEFRVNVEKGWGDLIHLFSHWYYTEKIGGRPHSKVHARIERKLRAWAIKNGWMNGALKKAELPPIPPPLIADIRAKKIEKRQRQIKGLERKIKALTTRLKRAKRSLGALERYAAKPT
jgi:hypothetical protein